MDPRSAWRERQQTAQSSPDSVLLSRLLERSLGAERPASSPLSRMVQTVAIGVGCLLLFAGILWIGNVFTFEALSDALLTPPAAEQPAPGPRAGATAQPRRAAAPAVVAPRATAVEQPAQEVAPTAASDLCFSNDCTFVEPPPVQPAGEQVLSGRQESNVEISRPPAAPAVAPVVNPDLCFSNECSFEQPAPTQAAGPVMGGRQDTDTSSNVVEASSTQQESKPLNRRDWNGGSSDARGDGAGK